MRRSLGIVVVFLFIFITVTKGTSMAQQHTAIFAGGCFWCMEPPFEQAEGVIDVTAGYTGGHTKNPGYEEVCSGATGHYEAIEVLYDPDRIRYEQLLAIFWQQIDPTDDGGQFADRGTQYLTAIFYQDEKQRQLAEASKKELAASGMFGDPILTAILPAGPFYRAEEHHQNYFRKHTAQYLRYKEGSGRAAFLKNTWKKEKSDITELKKILTPLQYRVTRENGTEPPFDNIYWDNDEQGIYVDIVSGEPLFASTDKFNSGTGWPSFSKPLEKENIVERIDHSLFTSRTEVRSRHGDSHLGHVFADGPPDTGLRYCINSAALRFIPRQQLEEEGYGNYLKLFSGKSCTLN